MEAFRPPGSPLALPVARQEAGAGRKAQNPFPGTFSHGGLPVFLRPFAWRPSGLHASVYFHGNAGHVTKEKNAVPNISEAYLALVTGSAFGGSRCRSDPATLQNLRRRPMASAPGTRRRRPPDLRWELAPRPFGPRLAALGIRPSPESAQGPVAMKGNRRERRKRPVGGSAVVLLLEPGRVVFDEDLLASSQKNLETLVRSRIGLAAAGENKRRNLT